MGAAKVCGVPFSLSNCNDDVCNKLCLAKYAPYDAHGQCGGPTTCLCFHVCGTG